MTKTEKINWKPEDNDYINKVFDVFNLILAFVVVLAPIITSFVELLGGQMDVLNVYIVFFILFFFSKIVYCVFNIRFLNLKNIGVLTILLTCLFLGLCTNALITGAINMTFLNTIGYVAVFITFYKVDKKYYKALLYSFIIMLTISSIMGMCDLHNEFMPGFEKNTFPMSLQFFNPNYSGYITAMAILMCIYILSKYKSVAEQIVFWICYVVLNVAMFINGCYSAETAMFLGELFLVIYLWINNKNCPWVTLGCMLISICASFVWIDGISTSGANYFYESLAVIDNKLGTHVLKAVTTFVNKIFGGGAIIDSVKGSDGWDRDALTAAALKEIFSGPRAFIIGGGAGLNYKIRVHNVYLHVWLEYGIINLLLYLSMLIILAVRLFKTKFSSYNIFLVATILATLLLSQMFGCLEPYSFTYYTILLCVLAREINEKYDLKKQENNKNESDNFDTKQVNDK